MPATASRLSAAGCRRQGPCPAIRAQKAARDSGVRDPTRTSSRPGNASAIVSRLQYPRPPQPTRPSRFGSGRARYFAATAAQAAVRTKVIHRASMRQAGWPVSAS